VGKVNLAKRTFQLGEAIKLVLDFESARIPCYQVRTSLFFHLPPPPAKRGLANA
jgi:hypothetical protein